MGLSFYVHYYVADYLGKKKAAIKRSADLPPGADVKYSTALQNINIARESLFNSISILKYNPTLAKRLSEIYTNFIFGTEISQNNKKIYDEETVKNFQNLFNQSRLNSQLKLYNDTNQVDLLAYLKYTEKAYTKGLVYKDNTTEELALLDLRKKIDRYCKMAEKTSGNNGFIKYSEAKNFLKEFDDLKKEIEKSKNLNKKGKKEGVIYYDLTPDTQNSLTHIIEQYNALVTNTQIEATTADQGYYGEALIAGINHILNSSAQAGIQNLLKYMQDELQKHEKQITLNDKIETSLRMVGRKDDYNNKQYIANKLFDTTILQDYFKSIPKSKISVEVNSSGGIDLTSKPTSTADVMFKWGMEDYGITIKNYRKGFKSNKGISIIKQTPLLYLLNLFPNSQFVNHFANITSSLRGPKGGKSTTNFENTRKKMKSTIALALLIRGLAGIKGESAIGGEAELFTMIDASQQKVFVYNTFDLLRGIFKIFQNNENAGLFKNSGFNMKGYPSGSIFNNDWEPIVNDEDPWDAARRRNAKYLIAAHKIKLSMSIMPDGWTEIFKNIGIVDF